MKNTASIVPLKIKVEALCAGSLLRSVENSSEDLSFLKNLISICVGRFGLEVNGLRISGNDILWITASGNGDKIESFPLDKIAASIKLSLLEVYREELNSVEVSAHSLSRHFYEAR